MIDFRNNPGVDFWFDKYCHSPPYSVKRFKDIKMQIKSLPINKGVVQLAINYRKKRKVDDEGYKESADFSYSEVTPEEFRKFQDSVAKKASKVKNSSSSASFFVNAMNARKIMKSRSRP